MNKYLQLLVSAGAFACAAVATVHAQTKAQIAAASQRGINYIINDTKRFNADNCFSCHNTGQAIRAGALAERSLDLTVDQAQLNRIVGWVNNQQYLGAGDFNGAVTHVGNANFVADLPYTTTSWAIFSLIGIDPAVTLTPYTKTKFLAGAAFVERMINRYGLLPADHVAPPVDTNNPGETARGVMILAKAREIDVPANAARWTVAIDRGVNFLRSQNPRNSDYSYVQDAGWIIMALKAAGLPNTDAKIAPMIALIKARQAADGGWSMATTSGGIYPISDAFGTGVALSSLIAAGETNSPTYPAFQRGIQRLLNTQQADGSWPSVFGVSVVSGSTWAVLSLTELAAAPPAITVPANLTVEATSSAGAVATYSATAVDDSGNNVAVTLSPASGSTFVFGTTTVTATATNADGNTATKTFTVTVVDTTKPIITLPPSQIVEATGPLGAIVTYSATATDTVSGSISVIGSPASGANFPFGLTTVNLSARDLAGNVGTGLFTVRVQDTTPPTLSAQADLVLEATGSNGAIATFAATASDLVSGNVTVLASPASGSTFSVGTTEVTLTAADARNNATSRTFSVTVRDTTAPVIDLLSPITVEATSAAGAIVTFAPTATDLVNGNVPVVATPASGSTFALGSTTVALSATDAAGNVGSGQLAVTVVDTIAPTLVLPANVVVEATSPAGAIATFAAAASDAVGATVAYSIAPGSVFPLGTTPVTITAKDSAGNTAAPGTLSVTVQDTTAPAIAAQVNLTAEATSAAGAVVTFAPLATDIASAVTITTSIAPGSTFPVGTTPVTITAKDSAGNTAAQTFTVTVADTTAPVIAPFANLTVEATSAAGATTSFAPSATDTVSSVTVTTSRASGSTFALGTTPVTITAKDASNNTSTQSFTVTVVDTTKPVIAPLANLTLEATSPAGATATFAATVTDAVGATATYSKASGSTFALGTTTVTVNATDAAGNVAVAQSFTVTVRDTTAPVFSSLTASTGSLWPANHKMVAITLTAATSDIAGAVTTKIVSITSSEPDNGLGDGDTANDTAITGAMTLNLRAERSGTGNGRTYTITVEAKDAAGNTTLRTTTVSVPKNQSGK